MRKKSFLIAMLLSVFAVMTTACHKDDDKDFVVPVYSYGITKSEFSTVSTTSDLATISGADEMTTIINAFADAFKTALGVTGTPFSYNGGDDKVIAACKQAEETLKDKTFKGKYTLEVNKTDGATKLIYTWNSPEPAEPEPEPEHDELPEYTILFYGHGGANLDVNILDNINQFFYADPKNLKKVNVAVQYKFSTAERFLETIGEDGISLLSEELGRSGEDIVQQISLQTMRFGINGNTGYECDEEEYDDFYPLWTEVIPDDDNYLDNENIDFGDPNNLVEFIKWGVENYPAEKYILLLSDHGGGYAPHDDVPVKSLTKGLIYDDGYHDNSVNGKSHLTITEVTDAISASGIKPEVIYMDACLMNAIENQFELKDAANYLVLSSFCVPGQGGYYTSLVNELATNDIETALTNFSNISMERWDSFDWKYSDMTVVRTSGLDAFGAFWKEFTDLLIDAYTNGGDEVKAKIDDVTGRYTLLVGEGTPSYAMTTYAANLAAAVPELLPASLAQQMETAFDGCIVEAVASKLLSDNDWLISSSILIGAQNHYTVFYGCTLDEAKIAAGTESLDEDYIVGNNYLFLYYRINADGTGVKCNTLSGTETPLNWGGSFDNTYKALKWDKATGWSRWIEVNEQDPVEFSPISFKYDFGDDSFTPTTK